MIEQLQQGAAHFGVSLADEPTYGRARRSIGAATTTDTYLRVRGRRADDEETLAAWANEEASSQIAGVPILKRLGSHDWEADGIAFRASLTELAPSPAVARGPFLDRRVDLPEEWWTELNAALAGISAHEADHVAVTQERISKRLAHHEGLDTTITDWATSHADLHWANLTAPKLALLDWERWGSAPAGYDPALLLCFSLPDPAMASSIAKRFAGVLGTRTGMLAQLFVCAELLAMAATRKPNPKLVERIQQYERGVLNVL